ncbi:lipoprotein-releasing ABC transporter ATP-binding protein LolD [Kangiella koreensis]|uniref:Lipoprotein-releasing system ATP-binding protein LolD n=1 Tax=Kangiella koreensis (strain DSM 16069 / JCM 12317 / KCTC 12182 / SW-125) TaxID=523791 RepID=C7RC04_KANKD|nr:lipoprotein-releasing ABC transporter ATP-binding protein LolD [Kangiella koreensis]ACV26796.1 lipoprotein releasing system, ATP-binding protein [Kangiella koreensis DSM 16069]
MNSERLIEITNLSRVYEDGASKVTVLESLNMTVEHGEQLAIVGASGSGKSTLLHLIGALDKPTQGEILINGQDVHKLKPKAQGEFRNMNIGFVYQFHHLLPEFTALENVAMPLVIRGINRDQAYRKAAALIERVGLTNREKHKPSELSGGERQRIAFARALANEPVCVLADEPTGNLDHATALRVYDLMCEINQEMGTTFITVTHDLELASKMQRQLKLEDGHLMAIE